MNPMIYVSIVTALVLIGLMIYIMRAKDKSKMHYIFLTVIIEILIWTVAVMMKGLFAGSYTMSIICENFTYFGIALVPVSLMFFGRAYSQPGKSLKPYLLLFIVPIITLVMIWTNDLHHLFFTAYPAAGADITPNMLGPFFWVHAIYSYTCLIVAFILLTVFAIRNSGVFSTQGVLVLLGSLVPTVINILYTLNLMGLDIYSTPLAFTFTVLMYTLALFRYRMLKVTPIALQTVINRISDSFVVVDPAYNVIDFNRTFINTFERFADLRNGQNFIRMTEGADELSISDEALRGLIEQAMASGQTLERELIVGHDHLKQYFTIEFTPIVQRDRCIAVILLLKDVTQHVRDMEQIRENQAIMLERERLASLGQLIGGIAHNLKTPIMAVSGGIDQLECLTEEYEASVDDAEVTPDDHREIAAEMHDWHKKMKTHMGYMSDIISTVKDQATKLNNPEEAWFTLDELLKRVKILMQHELTKNKCRYRQYIRVDRDTKIIGDINSMVQVLDNIIVNAIQSYGRSGGDISIRVTEEDGKLLMAINDSGKGIPDSVKERLFKEMITTKGKHGTGLGLYMSYSTVKGMFRGDMWFQSREGRGTKFFIQLPLGDETNDVNEVTEDEGDA